MSVAEKHKKLSVADMRQELITKHNWSEKDAAKLRGKSRLSKKLSELEAAQDDFQKDFDDFLVEPEKDEREVPIEDVPGIADPGWNDYVLSQLLEEEFSSDDNGNRYPRVDGLRRVADKLLSAPIIRSQSEVVCVPESKNNWTAVASHTLVLDDGTIYSDVADANRRNTPGDFALHLVSSASSKAEGRVLRKALRLRHIICSEEKAADVFVDDDSTTDDDPISQSQINLTDTLSNRLDIDVAALIFSEYGTVNVTELNHQQGANIIEKLNQFQTNHEDIPVQILGYKHDWRDADE